MNAVFELFLPRRCAVCGAVLLMGEQTVCTACRYDAPLTNYWHEAVNPVAERFWGIIPVANACSFLFFVHGSGYRDLIHSFKYQGQWRVAEQMGEWFGSELKRSGLYDGVEVVVPIPLHPRKRIRRGYNQAEYLARGIARGLGIEVDTGSVTRRVHNPSQARRTASERWSNVEGVFAVRRPERISGRHVLLVDDVMTTGATVISCAETILRETVGSKISIATLATTQK